jgi:hypothetical protein
MANLDPVSIFFGLFSFQSRFPVVSLGWFQMFQGEKKRRKIHLPPRSELRLLSIGLAVSESETEHLFACGFQVTTLRPDPPL